MVVRLKIMVCFSKKVKICVIIYTVYKIISAIFLYFEKKMFKPGKICFENLKKMTMHLPLLFLILGTKLALYFVVSLFFSFF